MKILISGSSGFVGSELVVFLQKLGHEVWRLVRYQDNLSQNAIFWDPQKKIINPSLLEHFDVVIHLAGENIASGRWTTEKKRRIFESRVGSTLFLSEVLSKLKFPPRCFISASAIGIYGDKGTSYCNEYTHHGTNFLADVCEQWEAATLPAKNSKIRTVNLRFGIVLSAKGGALAKMLPIFKWGLGGRLGSGQQYMSWITIDDLMGVVLFAATNQTIEGPYNVVSPYPVTNSVFTAILARTLGCPAILPVPAFALNLLMGKEMAGQLLLNSTRVEPSRLTQAGYAFLFPDLAVALKHLLSGP